MEESPHPLAHIPSKEGRGIWGQVVPKAEHHIPVWGAFPLARLKRGSPERNLNGVPCRVQRFSGENQMNTHNLAIVFGPTLFQTDGKDYKAGRVVEDLISHYVKIFNVGSPHLWRCSGSG